MSEYANRRLRPVEVLTLVRHREDFSGRVLELGCGAGRVISYLAELASEAHGLDLSERMLVECRRRYPGATFSHGDMRDLSRYPDESFGAVVAANNLIDIFGDDERRAALREMRRVLAPGGLLVLSSHNRAHLPSLPRPGRVRTSDPLRFTYDLLRAPLALWRHRRLAGVETEQPGYALISDGSHGYRLVHYYVDPAAGRRQLEEEGFTVLACLDLDGRELGPDDEAPECPELHYLARRAERAAPPA